VIESSSNGLTVSEIAKPEGTGIFPGYTRTFSLFFCHTKKTSYSTGKTGVFSIRRHELERLLRNEKAGMMNGSE
jgi:hypothetical protein